MGDRRPYADQTGLSSSEERERTLTSETAASQSPLYKGHELFGGRL